MTNPIAGRTRVSRRHARLSNPRWPSDPRVVDDATAYHREHRTDLLQLLIRHGEVVVAQDDHIGQFPGLDGADLFLLPKEPAVARCIELQGLLARDLLPTVD